jgi:hypothetical protein
MKTLKRGVKKKKIERVKLDMERSMIGHGKGHNSVRHEKEA